MDTRTDRISELPDDLLLLILFYLAETLYMVRTSILSRRWKHLWRTSGIDHNLRFSYSVFATSTSAYDFYSYTSFVDGVLRSLPTEATINSFAFDCPCRLDDEPIQSIIRNAVTRHLRHLEITIDGDCIELPTNAYTSESLKVLELAASGLPACWKISDNQLSRPIFCFLEVLRLEGVLLQKEQKNGKVLTLHMQNLRSLSLDRCSIDVGIQICAPGLIKLEIGHWVFDGENNKIVVLASKLACFRYQGSIPLKWHGKLPRLDKVEIHFYEDHPNEMVGRIWLMHLVRMLKEFHIAESIFISGLTLELMHAYITKESHCVGEKDEGPLKWCKLADSFRRLISEKDVLEVTKDFKGTEISELLEF